MVSIERTDSQFWREEGQTITSITPEKAQEIMALQRSVLEEKGKNLFDLILQAAQASDIDSVRGWFELGKANSELVSLSQGRNDFLASGHYPGKDFPDWEFSWTVSSPKKDRGELNWKGAGMEIIVSRSGNDSAYPGKRWKEISIEVMGSDDPTQGRRGKPEWIIKSSEGGPEGSAFLIKRNKRLEVFPNGNLIPEAEMEIWTNGPVLKLEAKYGSFTINEGLYRPLMKSVRANRETRIYRGGNVQAGSYCRSNRSRKYPNSERRGTFEFF